MTLLICVLVAILYCSVVVGAANIYVSTKGTDALSCSSGGSSTKPFYSLSQATKCANEGDTILMGGGDYEYSSIVQVTTSLTVTNVVGESPRIKIYNCRAPFVAIAGNVDFTFQNIAVSGFNVIDQNIPTSSFIYNAPGFALANSVTLSNVDFQNWDAYDNSADFPTHVISGLYNSLTITGCTFTTTQSYYNPNTHIRASAVKALVIANNKFMQPVTSAFVADPEESKATGGVVTFANNTFSFSSKLTKATPSVSVTSDIMSWVVKDTTFSGLVKGPTCSFASKHASSDVVHVAISGSTFDSLNNSAVLSVSGGCVMTLADSVVSNSISNSPALITCSSSTLTVKDSTFVNDATAVYPLSSCNNCKFTSSNNDLTKVKGNTGTCSW